jgi:hypothetical protein
MLAMLVRMSQRVATHLWGLAAWSFCRVGWSPKSQWVGRRFWPAGEWGGTSAGGRVEVVGLSESCARRTLSSVQCTVQALKAPKPVGHFACIHFDFLQCFTQAASMPSAACN